MDLSVDDRLIVLVVDEVNIVLIVLGDVVSVFFSVVLFN